MSQAKYEIIDDEEPYYGEVPGLEGVWASGKTLEECRHNLAEVIDGWLVVRLKRGLSVPDMIKGNLVLTVPNPHRKEIGVPLLSKILKQAQVSKEAWLGE